MIWLPRDLSEAREKIRELQMKKDLHQITDEEDQLLADLRDALDDYNTEIANDMRGFTP